MPEKVRSIKNSPELIVRAGLGDGDWMHFSKLTARALIRPEIFDLKVNVLGVLMLHAFGFGTELGVIMRRLKKFEDIKGKASIAKVFPPAEPGGPALLTEVMSSRSIATLLYRYGMEAYEEAKVMPSAGQVTALKQSRQNIRRVLETLEEDGLVDRARLNCPATDLAELGYEEAVKRKLLTPLSLLPEDELKRLGGRGTSVGIFLLAKPRAAKTFGQRAGYVVTHDYIDQDNSANSATTEQLYLTLGEQVGVDPAVLKANPEMQALMAKTQLLNERRQKDEDAYQRSWLLMVSKAELLKREQGKPTLTGKQKDLNFSKASALNSNGTHSKMNTPPVVEGNRSNGDSAARAENTSASLNPTGQANEMERPISTTTPSRRDAEPSLVSQPRNRISEPEVQTLLEVMRRYCPCDDNAGRLMVTLCRDHAPLCTAVQIAEQIAAKGPYVLKRKRNDAAFNPIGFLLKSIPLMFEGAGGEQLAQRMPPASVVKCAGCGRELGATETTVSGQCGDCLAAHYKGAHGD